MSVWLAEAPNFGVVELLVILVVLAVVVGGVAALIIVIVKATRPSRPIHPVAPPPNGFASGPVPQRPPFAAPPAAQPGRSQEDLATRVRRLKQEGRTDQAIHLVIGETGMGHSEATQFVNAL
ncbi:hypothetical protein [Nonomuraea helvata]|uniref:Uncharacterized protein n=1 Tax=Nonomuraea helvata TaxID=37484 RepID=A0ABV5RVV2_9ACTN